MQQKTFTLIGITLVVALLIPAGYALWNINTNRITKEERTSSPTITVREAQAFGDLSGATAAGSADGKGGGSGSVQRTNDQVMAPLPPGEPYEPTVYVYTYSGNIQDNLTKSTGTVYERQAFSAFDGSVLSTLSGAFSHLNMDTFLSGKLTSFVLSVNDYMISLDTPSNMWSMYKNWSTFTDVWTPLQAADLPSDEVIISTARNFAATWGIELAGYGEPVIAEPEIALARAGAEDVYIPESVTVVFPLLVEGNLVYPAWTNAPTGLRISINLRDMSVTNAYDALSQTYNASSYELTQDATLVEKLIAGGGSLPATYDGMAINEVPVELNAPEEVLMEYALYENGISRTLFVPALRFTIKDPTQIPWTSGVITVPLVKDIAETQGSPMPYLK